MDKDIKEKSGPFEKQTAELFEVTEEAVLVAEKLQRLPELLASEGQKKITVGNRKKRLDAEMKDRRLPNLKLGTIRVVGPIKVYHPSKEVEK